MSSPRNLSFGFSPWKGGVDLRHRSLWIDEAYAREHVEAVQRLPAESTFDLCIVGGGYTGLWTAIRVLEASPCARVCIVEADYCGSGASGRNSGAAGTWWGKLPVLLRLFEPSVAKIVLQASEAGIEDIYAFTAEHAPECNMRAVEAIWAATAPAQAGAWAGILKAAASLGLESPYRVLSAVELKGRFDIAPMYGALLDTKANQLHPALLARALRRRAIQLGCQIFERSPVDSVQSETGHVRVKIGTSSIRAQQVFLAANAWMCHLPELRSFVHVTSSDMIVTDPMPEIVQSVSAGRQPYLTNFRQMLNYGGTTPDGRLYLGRGGGSLSYGGKVTPDCHWSASRSAELEADFRFLYPPFANAKIARGWAGPIDRSVTGLPFYGRLRSDDRVSFAIGFTGHGVGATALSGRIMAAKILGINDGWAAVGRHLSNADSGSFPAEPIRYLAGSTIRNAIKRKENREQRGLTASIIDRKLATFATATIRGSRTLSGSFT